MWLKVTERSLQTTEIYFHHTDFILKEIYSRIIQKTKITE